MFGVDDEAEDMTLSALVSIVEHELCLRHREIRWQIHINGARSH